jgi:general secretion pathway protein G
MVMTKRRAKAGFTLIELLVVMAIIATLLTLTMPRYFHSVDKSKEAALQADLNGLRDAIDKYYSDTGKYPDTLDDLVAKKYVRSIPPDPLTESNQTWLIVAPEGAALGKIFNIKSGAPGNAMDGRAYGEW